MKRFALLALAIALSLSLCGCGSERDVKTASYEPMYASADMYAENEARAGEGVASYAVPVKMAGGITEESAGDALPEINPDKIIYSSDVTVETTDFDASLEKLTALIEKYGGFVESSSVNGANYSDISRGRKSLRSASYTLRIPAESFDTLMQGLTDLGNVPYSHVYTDKVSAQYYDTQSRLNSYKTQEQSLLRLLEKAESVEDIITVEDKLSQVRYNIESLQSKLNGWDRQVSYSTVYMSINEVAEYTPAVVVNPSFGERIATAFTDGISGAVEFLGDALVWLIEALPALVLLAAVIFALSFPVKKLRAKRKLKKAAKTAKPESKENVKC